MQTWNWRLFINSKKNTEDEKKLIIRKYCHEGKDAFFNEAKKKKVLPFVAKTLVELNLDVDFWGEILDSYRKRNKTILSALDEVYFELKKQGVKKMFVSENFGSLLSVGGDIGLFASGDVDNYADPIEKEKIYCAFENLGYSRTERFSGKHQIAAEFFPPKDKKGLPDGFYVSVDFYPLARLKLPCFVKADDFVDWDKVNVFKDTAIALPPPTALMYICLLHISLHSFSRAPDIRLYVDLLNMAQTPVDYDKIEEWCRRDHTCTRVSTAADICNIVLRTDLPKTIISLPKRKERIKKIVLNTEVNDLNYEPNRLEVLKIEVFCDDFSDLHGILSILHPDIEWMIKTYGGSGVIDYIKHFIKVLK